MEELRAAVSRCPFLHRVGTEQGEGVALQIAAQPFRRATEAGRPLLEEGGSFEATVRLFHGPSGVVPLKRFAAEGGAGEQRPQGGCPFHHRQARAPEQASAPPTEPSLLISAPVAEPKPAAAARPFRSVPVASMGLSAFGFLPDPGEFFRRGGRLRGKAQQAKQQKPGQQQGQQGKPARGGGGGGGGGGPPGSGAAAKPSPTSNTTAPKGPAAPGAGTAGGGGSSGASSMKAAAGAAPAGGGGGRCPMRKFFGPLGGLLPLSAAGHLQCPSAIIKMRAAVAALKPVRDLRPQALPVKALAMGATAVAANVPCGMWREHTRKFSPEWFLAVHATIPFVAMLRKAVLMPKWAILLTVLGAVAGQQAGARLERARLAGALGAAPAGKVLAGAPAGEPRTGGASRGGARGAKLVAPPQGASGCRGEASGALGWPAGFGAPVAAT